MGFDHLFGGGLAPQAPLFLSILLKYHKKNLLKKTFKMILILNIWYFWNIWKVLVISIVENFATFLKFTFFLFLIRDVEGLPCLLTNRIYCKSKNYWILIFSYKKLSILNFIESKVSIFFNLTIFLNFENFAYFQKFLNVENFCSLDKLYNIDKFGNFTKFQNNTDFSA